MEEMCNGIRMNTNLYADYIKKLLEDIYVPIETKKWQWTPIKHDKKLWNFFTNILSMGINKVPGLKDYWFSNSMLGYEKVPEIMGRDRFLDIYKFLDLSDRSKELHSNHENYHIMQKIDTFMKDLMENFQKYFISYIDLLIDESSVKYKGRLGIIQHMP